MIMNFEFLHAATCNDTELEHELFLSFYESISKAIADLKDPECTDETYKQRMHKVKGSSANLGMEDLSACAKQAEELEPGMRPDAVLKVEKAFNDLFDHLKEEGILTAEDIASASDPMRGL